MEILKFPHENLFKKCKEVTVFSSELVILLEAMWDTMKANNGMGLASNQVGLDYSMFVMEGPKEEKLFLVNPKILKKSIVLASIREGCLSAPKEFVVIKERTEWVQVQFQDEKGNIHKKLFNDIHSICVQHEMEHLVGKSYLQSKSIPKDKRKQLAKKWGIK